MDDKGRVVDAQPEDTSFSHKIIEMFMVEANEAVARLLESLDVPFLRRIHPKPDFDAMQDLSRFVRATGHSIARKITPAAVQDLLETVKNKPASYAINLAVLKTLSSAEYSPEPIGHFALASEAYTHFTSPIRRYPDLTIHRLLDLYVKGELKPPRKRRKDPLPPPNMPDFETLEEEGRDLSCLERRADDAEKELKNLKVLTLLKKHQGEEFTGVVTGVTSFGLFVQHPKYLIDGLLRFEDLGDDWWEADVRNGKVIGRRSGRSLGLGSEIEVKIAAIDLTARTMALVSESKKKTGGQNSRRRGQTKRKSSGSKRRHKSNRRGKH
jgi:ribonuclease R